MMQATSRLIQRILILLGVSLLVYAGGSVLYAGIYQKYQAVKFDRELAAPQPMDAAKTLAMTELQDGDVVGKLEIPDVGISVMVFQGDEENTLRLGAGHVPGTPLPGAEGNVAIAAHRDTFFRKLEGIRTGANIQFETLRRSYSYVVESTEIVEPTEMRVIESRDRSELTLITCFPFHYIGSAPQRFIVHARLLPED